jgi:hypothetical protein
MVELNEEDRMDLYNLRNALRCNPTQFDVYERADIKNILRRHHIEL